jgi:subtilisin family serine protease
MLKLLLTAALAQGAPDPLSPTPAQVTLNLEDAWTVSRGHHAWKIAHLDTGWNLHADLGLNVLGELDLVDGGRARDTLGHGTAMLSVLAANTDNGIGVAGTAPSGGVLEIRGGAAGMTQAMAVDAMQAALSDNTVRVYLIEQAAAGWDSPQWRSVVRRAARRGTVICAAGNQGGDLVVPDSFDLIVVAGANLDGTRWQYSNYGTACDIAAPAGGLLAYYQDGNGNGLVDDFYGGSGTSVSAAYAAGVAALVYAAKPGIAPHHAKAALLGPAQTSWVRHGILDAEAAVARAAAQR